MEEEILYDARELEESPESALADAQVSLVNAYKWVAESVEKAARREDYFTVDEGLKLLDRLATCLIPKVEG